MDRLISGDGSTVLWWPATLKQHDVTRRETAIATLQEVNIIS
jgi:hypothetical protein